ncbi:MAG: pyridoxamine 5'-phosphate oxidase family protein [Alphaproteobacteria bacterium]
MSVEAIKRKVETLQSSVATMVITTMREDNLPTLGYLPFIIENDELYIFTSTLAEHGANLKAGRDASVMFIEDEADAKKISARTRAIFQTDYELVEKGDCQTVIDRFVNEVDESYEVLAMMADFSIYKLSLKDGRYVQGFGAAFSQDENGDWQHLKF